MTEKAPIPIDLLDLEKSTPLIQAWFEIAHLKQLFREGWLQRNISEADCETVAEHTFGNAMLCLMLLPRHPELDALRVLRLALLHDLGEVYVGDITPSDNVPKAEKQKLEHAAMKKILDKLPEGQALMDDWLAYEAQDTPEAQFVKQIDRLEFAMQASIYKHQGKVDPTGFYDVVEQQLTSEALREEMRVLKTL